MNIEEKIKNGYFYKCGGEMSVLTGSGGALMYIDIMREKGIPDSVIEKSIFII